jgi:acyl-CoA thioester hydrolase
LEHQDQRTRVPPWPVRVYYHHTDAGGVVYHGTYLDFFEAARIELLHACGFDIAEMAEARHAMFIVYRLKVDYHKPARLNDRLAVTAEIGRVGRARVIFDQRILRGADVLVSATVEAACVHPRTLRPVPLPDEIREKLEALA